MRTHLAIWIILLFPFHCLTAQDTGTTPLASRPDTLVVGYSPSPPFLEVQDGKFYGASWWLWEQLVEEHDLTYQTVEYTLEELLVALREGKVDLSISPLTITSNRLEDIDFSSPYYIAHSGILTHNVSSAQKAIDFLKSFFSLNFFRALAALAIVILIFGFLEWLFERKVNEEEFGGGIRGLWSGFWWSAVTMTTVGYGDKSPRTLGGRIVALVWMFTAIIIISGFTASIASALTVNQIGASGKNMEDFKEEQLGTIQRAATEEWLKTNFFSNRTTYADIPTMLAALDRGEIKAVAYSQPELQATLRRDTNKQYRLLEIKYNPQFYAMGMRRGLPEELRKTLSVSILEQTERMDWKILLSEYDLQ